MKADKMISDAGQVRHSYRKPYYTVQGGQIVRPCGPFAATGAIMTYGESIQIELHQALAYKYALTELVPWLRRLFQLSQSLGVNLDAGIIWDAIPFSFVVDWFVNVSEWIHGNVSVDFPLTEVKLLSLCDSSRIIHTRSLTWERQMNTGFGVYYASDRIFDQTQVFYARRKNVLPRFVARTQLEYNKKQWKVGRIINATALIAQGALKPRRLPFLVRGR
jgi:hypothetical protein